MVVVGAATAAVLAALSALHVYWALGGRRGWDAAIPEAPGAPMFQPGKLATVIVALLLAVAAAIVAWMIGAGAWTIAVVFAGRAVGDFRLFGFFKTVKTTRFSRMDSIFYTPLCLVLAAACAAVAAS